MAVVKINKAESVYVNHETASYGIFCYNSVGDLFLNSDWGMFGYAWRAFGDDFKDFLKKCNADYIIGKFELNYREVSGKKLPAHKKEALTILFNEFKKAINEPSEEQQ